MGRKMGPVLKGKGIYIETINSFVTQFSINDTSYTEIYHSQNVIVTSEQP